MSIENHIEALKRRHAELDARIEAESRAPAPDDAGITALKKEKLRIKEQIHAHERAVTA